MTATKEGALTLVNITVEDSARIAGWRNLPEVRRASLDDSPTSEVAQRKWYLETYVHDQSQVRFLVELDGEPVGYCGLKGLGWKRPRNAKIAVLLDPDFRGRGLAERALLGLVNYAFEERGVDRLTAEVFSWNEPAIRLYGKVGFRQSAAWYRLRGDKLNVMVLDREKG